MKLSKLYSNQSSKFEPIEFVSGLNVVEAQIRLPENLNLDTHNLGKTTLGQLIDFCLLSDRKKDFFLFKYSERFNDFIFFLELEVSPGSYVTIRRHVETASRIAFKEHQTRGQSFVDLPQSAWSHDDVPLDKARILLDSILNLNAIKPWNYRKVLGYLVRSQDDYQSVFQLHTGYKHSDWKPFLAHVLGFDSSLLTRHFELDKQIEEKKLQRAAISGELGESVADPSKLHGVLLLKRRAAEKGEALIERFDFRVEDKNYTKTVVDKIDGSLAELNALRYSLSYNRKKILASLGEGQILFDPEQAATLFEEAGVLFAGQIRKSFEQLIAFNSAISAERSQYLSEELAEVESSLAQTNLEINKLGKQRSDLLAFISKGDSFEKYRKSSQDLISLRVEIEVLERQIAGMERMQKLRHDLSALTESANRVKSLIEEDVELKNADSASLFSAIRVYFSDIVEEVVGSKALIKVSQLENGSIEFQTEILDEAGKATSADLGHTYKKLLCVAFDLSILRAHLGTGFPVFVFHDGVFESLDDRKKEKLLGVIRDYAGEGIQSIITVIDSDIPGDPRTRSSHTSFFGQDEVVLTLHDENDQGRLFKMARW